MVALGGSPGNYNFTPGSDLYPFIGQIGEASNAWASGYLEFAIDGDDLEITTAFEAVSGPWAVYVTAYLLFR